MIQQDQNILPVRQTDLLPHDRGRGGDPGDILKASGSDGFHQFIRGILFLDEIYQRSGDHMRKVTYRTGDEIVLPVIHKKGYGTNGFDEAAKGGYGFFRNAAAGSQDVVGILQKQGLGIDKSDTLASCHRMASDETVL